MLSQVSRGVQAELRIEWGWKVSDDRGGFTVKKIGVAGHNINRVHSDKLLPVVLPWLAPLD